jgi:glycerol uptake facilitator-like aquaporin
MNMTAYFAEFIGTAIFLAIILKSNGDKYVIVLGLLAAILLMGTVSGGHFNPAISFMTYFNPNKSITFGNKELAGYVIAQLLGAMCAIYLVKYFPEKCLVCV